MDKHFPNHVLEIIAHSMSISQLARQACLFGDFDAEAILRQRRRALAMKYARAWRYGIRLQHCGEFWGLMTVDPQLFQGVLGTISQLGRALALQPELLNLLANKIHLLFFYPNGGCPNGDKCGMPSEPTPEMLSFYADLADALFSAEKRGYFCSKWTSLANDAREFFKLFEKYAHNASALRVLHSF